MRYSDLGEMNCSIARPLSVLGERWTLMVLRQSFLGAKRFEDIQRDIGIARNTLADRLQTLVGEGILERQRYQERPPRYEYRLTPKGLDLYPVLVALMQWGEAYMPSAHGHRVNLVHKTCGHITEPRLVCSHCGEEIAARDVRAEPGPGTLAETA